MVRWGWAYEATSSRGLGGLDKGKISEKYEPIEYNLSMVAGILYEKFWAVALGAYGLLPEYFDNFLRTWLTKILMI